MTFKAGSSVFIPKRPLSFYYSTNAYRRVNFDSYMAGYLGTYQTIQEISGNGNIRIADRWWHPDWLAEPISEYLTEEELRRINELNEVKIR